MKSLYLTIQGFASESDIEKVRIATSFKILQTGLPTIGDGPDISLNVKSDTGTRKDATTLNGEVLSSVLSYIDRTYKVVNFDNVYIIGTLTIES